MERERERERGIEEGSYGMMQMSTRSIKYTFIFSHVKAHFSRVQRLSMYILQ